MKTKNAPLLSVIFVTPDTYDTVRTTLSHLKKQTMRSHLEIIVVAPSLNLLELDAADLDGFHSYQAIESGPLRSIAHGYVLGVQAANAPLVALGEDHSYPEPEWAESFIKRHKEPWAAVGPAVLNGNPQSRVSWADFLIAYGPWTETMPSGEVDHLPGHNSCYKRDILLGYGDKLERLMQSESVLHWDLRAKGYKLYLDPAVRTSHMNFGVIQSWLPVQFSSARVFAGSRAQGWPAWKRIVHVCGSPLTVAIRLSRILRNMRNHRKLPDTKRGVIPIILGALTLRSVAEAYGYAFGEGTTMKKLFHLEARRIDHAGSGYHAALENAP